MADKKTVAKKDAAKPAVEKKVPTAAQIACVNAAFFVYSVFKCLCHMISPSAFVPPWRACFVLMIA